MTFCVGLMSGLRSAVFFAACDTGWGVATDAMCRRQHRGKGVPVSTENVVLQRFTDICIDSNICVFNLKAYPTENLMACSSLQTLTSLYMIFLMFPNIFHQWARTACRQHLYVDRMHVLRDTSPDCPELVSTAPWGNPHTVSKQTWPRDGS